MTASVLAIDFGTSNSAAAVLVDGQVHRIAIEEGDGTLPTAVFFPSDRGAMQVGRVAGAALIAGEEGRYMRALKSILGTPLLHQSRLIESKRRTLAEIITAFLVEIKTRAETQTGQTFTKVLSGRPVHFHSKNAEQDAQAEVDLRACYRAAGFDEVSFLYEPEAAARTCVDLDTGAGLGLIVDIGGGTSDCSVFRVTGGAIDILASHGIRLGGTDFDQRISVSHVMPLLGKDSQVRRTFGEGLLPVPGALFQDLATWAKIPFLYTRETERLIADLLAHAVEPVKIGRLREVIAQQLGHEIAFAVERGKIAANHPAARAAIDLGSVERGLEASITSGTMTAALARFRAPLQMAIYETLMQAGVKPADIGTAVMVGGSSLMRIVSDEVQTVCPTARIQRSDAFTAVVDGLALATRE